MSKRERSERTERSAEAELALRAADADRQVAVATLQRHFVSGRLTDAELGERIKLALSAQTHGELAGLFADLPAEVRTAARPELVQRRRHQHSYRWRTDWGHSPHVRVYLGVMVLLVAIWLMTTPGGYFWPMWPALGWGISVFAHGSARKCGVREDESPAPPFQMT
jgi:hypothetical protein